MGETLARPDVTVEQVFEEPAVTLIAPALPVVVMGVNNQIEFRQSAGDLDDVTIINNFNYPNRISGTTVGLASVKVFLFASDGVFELDGFTADANKVAVAAFNDTLKILIRDSLTGQAVGDFNETPISEVTGETTISTLTFEDAASGAFIADGVRPGMQLRIKSGADIGFFEVASVESDTSLTVKATPETGFTGFAATAAALTYFLTADYSTFKDESTDFFAKNVVPGRNTIIKFEQPDGTARSFIVEAVDDVDTLRLNLEHSGGIATGDSTVGTGDFSDSGAVDFAAAGVKVGWKLIIEDGLDAGTYDITAVVTTTLTVTPNFPVGAVGANYRISQTLTAETGLKYSIEETRFDRTGTVLISWDGVRIDNVDKLVTVQTTADVLAKLGAPVPENPLAFAAFWAVQNTDTTVFATAVAADSILNWSQALDFLETEEVYSLVPLTQDLATQQLFDSHVTSQSALDGKHERKVFINRELFVFATRTTEPSPDVGATITDSTSPTLDTFEDIGADFVTDGVVTGDEIAFSFVDGDGVTQTEKTRASTRDSATALTLLNGLTAAFIIGWNAAVAPNRNYIITSPPLDKFDQAENIADFSRGFANRRVTNVWPDLVEFTYTDDSEKTDFKTQDELDGVTTLQTGNVTRVVDGFYLAAAIGGQVAGEESEQPFTNLNIVGPVGLRNSNKYFTETQLDIIATGGTYIVIQEIDNGPTFSRHQLSTDISLIEKRELSVTKNVDFISKFMRNQLRPYIGKFNITDIYLEQLRSVVSAILASLKSDGKIITGTIVTLEQSTTQSDTVLLEIDILVPFPANFIRVTLFI
jgi:hypothetical protein